MTLSRSDVMLRSFCRDVNMVEDNMLYDRKRRKGEQEGRREGGQEDRRTEIQEERGQEGKRTREQVNRRTRE